MSESMEGRGRTVVEEVEARLRADGLECRTVWMTPEEIERSAQLASLDGAYSRAIEGLTPPRSGAA